MSSKNPAIREQSLWALGNIAGEGAQERDIVLSKGIVAPLIHTMEAEGDFARDPSRPVSSLVKTAVWAMSNLCRNKNPLVSFNKVRGFLPIIMNVLHAQNNDVLGIGFDFIFCLICCFCYNLLIYFLGDACWALSYLTDGPDERIEAVQQHDILPQLVPLLGHPVYTVQTPALRAVGNMLTGSNEQVKK